METETVAFPLEDGGQVLVRVAAVEPTYGGVVTRGGEPKKPWQRPGRASTRRWEPSAMWRTRYSTSWPGSLYHPRRYESNLA